MSKLIRYKVEIFFWKDKKKTKEMDENFNESEYLSETMPLDITTWDDVRGEIKKQFPEAAYVKIHQKTILGGNREGD